jgi:hypothetical protein
MSTDLIMKYPRLLRCGTNICHRGAKVVLLVKTTIQSFEHSCEVGEHDPHRLRHAYLVESRRGHVQSLNVHLAIPTTLEVTLCSRQLFLGTSASNVEDLSVGVRAEHPPGRAKESGVC